MNRQLHRGSVHGWRPLLLAAFVLVASSALSFAQTALSADDRAQFQKVILDQLHAFQRDDGAAAFSLAAPGIRETFGTPETFMEMVRDGYQPVYRPQSFEFGQATVGPYGPEQRVFVRGPDGKDYIAVYPMERQSDGRWLVNGCMLKRPESV